VLDWQTIAVVLIVAAAVLFLLRQFVLPRRRRSRPAQTFVPLGDVRKRDDRRH
jgi:predicted MFS family arabinose efflux permease